MAKVKKRIEWRLTVDEDDPLCERINSYIAALPVLPTYAQLLRHLVHRGIDADREKMRKALAAAE
jgi:hypothetical protein